MSISDVLKATEPDFLLGGEAADLVEVTDRIGMQHNAAEREELSGDEDVPATDSIAEEKSCPRTKMSPMQIPSPKSCPGAASH